MTLLVLGFVALLAAQTTQPALKASIDRGKKVYDVYCVSCHQANGKGVPNLNPPLAATDYVTGDKAKLIRVILKGLATNEPINDEYYSNTMPPQQFLKDQDIADVLTYVRNSFGNKAGAISPAEVKTVRAKTK
jgi:mono/diheme cytochrome c family protein